MLLVGNNVTKYFGGIGAVKNVVFTVKKKEIVGLIGPNGAGKTTLFNLICGIYHPTSGAIEFRGKDITQFKPNKICRFGIGRTFQIVRTFLDFTAMENVMIGAAFGKGTSLSDARCKSLSYLEFVGLKDKKDLYTKNLNFNDRKLVEIARALSADPQIILLDEVFSGLNPSDSLRTMTLIESIRDEFGIAVFWVEHVMKAIMEVADRIIVLHHGEKIAEGVPREIANNKKVIESYLGEKYLL